MLFSIVTLIAAIAIGFAISLRQHAPIRGKGFLPGNRTNMWTARLMVPVVAAAFILPIYLIGGCAGQGTTQVKSDSSLQSGHAVSSDGTVHTDSFTLSAETSKSVSVNVPNGTKFFAMSTAGLDSSLTSTHVVVTPPSGTSGQVDLSAGAATTQSLPVFSGNPTSVPQSNTVLVRNAQADDSSGCLSCSAGEIQVSLANPTPGVWHFELGSSKTGYEMHAMTIGGNGPTSKDTIATTGAVSAMQAHSSVATRGGCNFWVHLAMNAFCSIISWILGSITAALIYVALERVGLAWIVNDGDSLPTLVSLCHQAVNRGCGWLVDQICSRLR